jgi:hypothetical protein
MYRIYGKVLSENLMSGMLTDHALNGYEHFEEPFLLLGSSSKMNLYIDGDTR